MPPSSSTEQVVEIDPQLIYFTFSRIRPRFSCGRTIESTLQQFRSGELHPRDLPLLSVLTDGTHYFSQNNRRLYTYKQLQQEGLLTVVPVRLRPFPQTKRMQHKYTADTCSLTATLMRDVGRSAEEAAATDGVARDVEEDDASAEQQQLEVDATDECVEAGAPTNDGRRKKAEVAVEDAAVHNTDASTAPPSAAQSTSSQAAQQQQQKPSKENRQKNKRMQQQQQQQRGGGAEGRDSDDDEDGGGNTLEAELRKLGLQ